MLILFLFLLVLGIGGFLFVFLKEFKDGGSSPIAAPIVAASSSGVVSQELVELKAVYEACKQKVVKLERLIEEKNEAIAEFEKNVLSKDDHQLQVEKLKQILQGQIDVLKQENKRMREELSGVLEENVSLQAKAFAIDARKSPDQHVDIVPVKPSLLQDVFSADNKNNSH